MKLIDRIKKWFQPKPPLAALIFSEPDKDGVVTVTTPGTEVKMKMQTMSKEKLERFQLIGKGYTTEQINGIIKNVNVRRH